MESALLDQSEKEMASAAEAAKPWYRRALARAGLQGKVVLCFTLMLAMALGASTWFVASQSAARVSDMMGEQARQIAVTLSMASQTSLESHNTQELHRMGQDLLKARNIMFVAFADAEGRPLALSSRDPDFGPLQYAALSHATQSLMQVESHQSPVLGSYLTVTSPVLNMATVPPTRNSADPIEAVAAPMRLLGYVTVGISQLHEQQQLRSISFMIVGIGGLVLILTLPLSYALLHRIFLPIRQLVSATRRIAEGDLDTRVAIGRSDVIGTLSRSFNEMVIRVKSQQRDLEEANASLEQKVHDRTAQLETANKRLSAEIAEKEDFLRAVSHDLNAPLRNISGMAAMLLMKNRDKFDEDIIHRLERIQKNVTVETDLISELLELSRIKTRRLKLEPVNLEDMVRDLADMFENDLKSKGIGLSIDNNLPVLRCERARVRQVFQNLIDNAIKYMGDRPVKEIHVGCALKESEAEFYVRDTGIGIEPEDLDKVFYVFRRGKSQAVQNVTGKGVGLASVKSIIETYNGTIWVESRVGQGSEFRFTINGQYVVGAEAQEKEPVLV